MISWITFRDQELGSSFGVFLKLEIAPRESLLVTQKTQQINNAYESRCRSAKEKQPISLEDLRVERRSIVRWSRFEKRHVLSPSFAVHTLLL